MPDEAALMAQGFRPYRKTTLTFARKMTTPFNVRLLNGDTVQGKAGDYVCVSDDDSERWIVEGGIFENAYTPQPLTDVTVRVGSAQSRLFRQAFMPYRKHQITWAKKIDSARTVHTLEGDVSAQAGDYLCIGTDGELWPQQPARFESNYEPVAIHLA